MHDLLGLLGDLGETLDLSEKITDNRLTRKSPRRFRVVLFAAINLGLGGLVFWLWGRG